MKRTLFVSLFILLVFSALWAGNNVILFIGDGMGHNAVSIARYITVGPESTLVMERMPHNCWMKTYAKNGLITDSGAAGSAMATGVKTIIHRISTQADNTPNPTITELAQEAGYATGIITTMRVTHATPAAFTAHTESRYQEAEIAIQQMELKPNLLMGGGTDYYLPEKLGGKRKDGQNLIAAARQKGYTVVQTRDELLKVSEKTEYLLGLFADGHMNYEIDRPGTTEPSIAEMTEVALKILPRCSDKGFFLMVEGGRIDYAAHGNEFENLIVDVLALDKAVEKAVDYAKEDGNTLVIVTADHETGGLALIGYEGEGKVQVYAKENELIFPRYQYRPGEGLVPLGEHKVVANWASNPAILGRLDEKTPLGDHTPSDVWLGAMGPGAESFVGVIENTYLFEVMANVLGVR